MKSGLPKELAPMKHVSTILIILAICCDLSAEEGFTPLFSGESLRGWQSLRDNEEEGTGAFAVNEDSKAIHVYEGEEAGSQQAPDCLYTEMEYSHFVVKLEYKWLEKRFDPRVEHDRDAGLLFHVHGDLGKIWPNCVEMQLGESDARKTKERYVTGDLWVIGKDVHVMNARGEDSFYIPGGDLVAVGKDWEYDKSFIPAGNEKPHGEWNQITLTVRGAAEAIFELNGKVVNRIENLTYVVDGERVPLEKGRIGLQAEFAELMYRNIRIKPLPSSSELSEN